MSLARSSVEDPLQNTGREEGSREGDAHLHLWALQRAVRDGHAISAEVLLAACRRSGRRRVGVRPDAGAGHVAAGEAAGARLRGRRLLGVAARLLRLALGLLGALAELALLAGELLLLLLRLLDGLVGLARLLLGAARVRLRELRAQLGLARLGGGVDILGRGLPLLGALRIVAAHSGGSSPKIRRKTSAATLVVTIDASAPIPATSPDQARRLTKSLSDMAAQSMRPARRRSSRRCASWPARRPRRPAAAARRSSP